MSYIDDTKRDLVSDEGLRLKLYYDTRGIPTIGVGRNVRDDGISKPEALGMLDNDVSDRVQFLVSNYVWFVGLSDVRKRAFLNLAFATGKAGFAGFHEMIKAASIGDFATAAYQMTNSVADKEEPERIARLATMIRDG